jgi:hypothetical protein
MSTHTNACAGDSCPRMPRPERRREAHAQSAGWFGFRSTDVFQPRSVFARGGELG